MRPNARIDRRTACSNCLRPPGQCMCNSVVTLDNRLAVLVLQYPREQYGLLNSARLVSMALQNCVLRVGLSWRNLSQALGKAAEPSRWGVLYLGSGTRGKGWGSITDKKNNPVPWSPQFDGIVVLDGSWKQAKSLWWRNPWLLKIKRIVLHPKHGSLRRQAKREALSTAEAVALALEMLGEESNTCRSLVAQYRALILEPNAS
jgi:DTW domain-containing protein YfiP